MEETFNQKSYYLHKTHYEKTDKAFGALWENKDTVDYWRHERMYNCLDPLIEAYTGAKWLTIGDGRYGTDANYIISKGEENVLATDIANTYLQVAKENGFIKEFNIENAENLSYADESVDFVLCKESYHHFPRPMIALYEMLRVAKQGVILIEPRDPNISSFNYTSGMSLATLFQETKNIFKRLIGRQPYYEGARYETVGNYVYTISEREIEKAALGLNYDIVAFKGLNDYYLEGVEYEKKEEEGPLFYEIKESIRESDKRVKKGIAMPGLLVAVIFKSMPDHNFMDALNKAGFTINVLSKNPYIS